MRYDKLLWAVLALAAGVSPAAAQTAEFAECRTLAEYLPGDDVAYRPGVDAAGNPVVPADINAVPFELPDIMSIPLSVDFARRIPGGPAGLEADATIGFLEVHKTGRITYDGQDWTSQVHAICRGETLPVPAQGAAGRDGQAQAAPVQSPAAITAPNTSEGGGVKIQGGEARQDRYN